MMNAHLGYGNTGQALPLRQQPRNSKWADDNHQLTTPPPDGTTALSATKADLKPQVAVSASNSAGIDWEAHKHTINDLYMGQNLNLNEVVERMKAHGLNATPRVYKAQFARWGWSKYNCKRMRRDLSSGKAVVKSQGKSCYRIKRRTTKGKNSSGSAAEDSTSSDTSEQSPTPSASSSTAQETPMTTTTVVRRPSPVPHQRPTLPYHLAHFNDTTRFIQSILADIRSHVCNVFTLQPNWQYSQTTKIGLIKAYDYLSYDHFTIAMDAFVKNEHSNGGEILRQAFLEVEDAIQTDYSSTFYFLFIDLPDLFLHYNRHDILTILLGHIKRLTGSVRLRDKISGTGFAALHALAESDPSALQHYITNASALWCDLLSELRGPRDRSTLLAKRNYLRHARGANTAYRVGQLWRDYTVLMDEVQAQFGPEHSMSRHMKDVVLSTQMIHDYFVDGFVEQNERLIQSVEAKYWVGEPHATHPSTISSTTPTPLRAASSTNGTTVLLPTDSATSLADGPDLPSNPATNNPLLVHDNRIITPPPPPPPIPLDANIDHSHHSIIPIESWDVLERNIRSNCYNRLAYFFSHQVGDAGRALYYTDKAGEGWRCPRFWQLEAESALVWAGRLFEAESLRRCRLEAQYFRKLPETGEMMAASQARGLVGLGLGAMGIDERLFASSSSPPSAGMGSVVQ